MTAETTESCALSMIEEWSRPGLGRARSLAAGDAVAFLATAPAQPTAGNPGTTFPLARWFDLLDEAVASMPDGLTMLVHRVVASGEWAAVETESHSVVADGRLYNMRYTFWLRVVDGHVVELRQYFDTKYGADFFLDFATRGRSG